ncbi:hypothetical protein SLEP1_g38972 [Rubroshorea leprosula]|uniref:Uncharacterized protein n=1 Tax=Rubroshorea leprosula TaxID=152421 RepID=A0AAV5KYQ2_9ROSI|nr:hypothetical protein SLEP1_g38972 [Rubroshorea leprosula]
MFDARITTSPPPYSPSNRSAHEIHSTSGILRGHHNLHPRVNILFQPPHLSPSRHNIISTVNKVSSAKIRSHSALHNCLEMTEKDRPAVLRNKSDASSTVKSSQPLSTYRPMRNDLLGVVQKVVLDKVDVVTATAILDQPRGGPLEGNVGKHSLNGSASGSNHGSSTAVNTGGVNIESDNGIATKSGSGNASDDASWSGTGD